MEFLRLGIRSAGRGGGGEEEISASRRAELSMLNKDAAMSAKDAARRDEVTAMSAKDAARRDEDAPISAKDAAMAHMAAVVAASMRAEAPSTRR